MRYTSNFIVSAFAFLATARNVSAQGTCEWVLSDNGQGNCQATCASLKLDSASKFTCDDQVHASEVAAIMASESEFNAALQSINPSTFPKELSSSASISCAKFDFETSAGDEASPYVDTSSLQCFGSSGAVSSTCNAAAPASKGKGGNNRRLCCCSAEDSVVSATAVAEEAVVSSTAAAATDVVPTEEVVVEDVAPLTEEPLVEDAAPPAVDEAVGDVVPPAVDEIVEDVASPTEDISPVDENASTEGGAAAEDDQSSSDSEEAQALENTNKKKVVKVVKKLDAAGALKAVVKRVKVITSAPNGKAVIRKRVVKKVVDEKGNKKVVKVAKNVKVVGPKKAAKIMQDPRNKYVEVVKQAVGDGGKNVVVQKKVIRGNLRGTAMDGN